MTIKIEIAGDMVASVVSNNTGKNKTFILMYQCANVLMCVSQVSLSDSISYEPTTGRFFNCQSWGPEDHYHYHYH